jgi:hypothetical protein
MAHVAVGNESLGERNPRSKTSISHFPVPMSHVMFSTTRSWDSQFPPLHSFQREGMKLNFTHVVGVYTA